MGGVLWRPFDLIAGGGMRRTAMIKKIAVKVKPKLAATASPLGRRICDYFA